MFQTTSQYIIRIFYIYPLKLSLEPHLFASSDGQHLQPFGGQQQTQGAADAAASTGHHWDLLTQLKEVKKKTLSFH